MNDDGEPDLYELLEVDPGTTIDEARRAYKRLLRIFDARSPVAYGLYRPEELRVLQQHLKVAHELVMDPDRRRSYDQRRHSQGIVSPPRSDGDPKCNEPPYRPPAPPDALPALGIDDNETLCGEDISRARELGRLTLEDISDRTKISMFTLRCVESERYDGLPADTYLRGFLRQIAVELGMPPDRLVKDYFSRMTASEEK